MSRIVAFAMALSGLCLCASSRADDAEDKAVAYVKKLGGTVARDEKAPGKPVINVNLFSTKVTDEGLKELAPLKHLTLLAIRDAKVTDAGLKELATFKNLATLYLNDTYVTDAGLKELTALRNLTTLFLGDTPVADVGLKELAVLNNLTKLSLTRVLQIPAPRGVTEPGAAEASRVVSRLAFVGILPEFWSQSVLLRRLSRHTRVASPASLRSV